MFSCLTSKVENLVPLIIILSNISLNNGLNITFPVRIGRKKMINRFVQAAAHSDST